LWNIITSMKTSTWFVETRSPI